MGTRVKSRLKAKPSDDRGPSHFIKQWRKFRKMTQEKLADEIGVAVSTISQLESGKQGYSQATLEALAEALQCDPADLLMRNPTQADPLWAIWDGLDAPARNQLTEIASTFKRTGTP